MLQKLFSCALTMFLMTELSYGECAWEVSVTDESGDGVGTSSDFVLPCATEGIYVFYDLPGNEQFYVEIEDAKSGVLLAAQDMSCGCANAIAFKLIGGLPKGSTLRFRATGESCEGEGDISGQVTALFYSPSAQYRLSKCEGEN